MDITRIVLEMLEKRVDDRFIGAKEIVDGITKKIAETRDNNTKFVRGLAERLAKEAEEKLEKEVLKKFPNATFKNNWWTTPCFDVENGFSLNVEYDNGMGHEFDVLRGKVLESCKQIAIENGPKTAFGEIDKYLETVDPVKILKLSK
jgi:hypothetical protein